MKITLFINGLSGGGAERVICNIGNYLARRGNEVVILTFHNGKGDYYLDESIIRHGLISENEIATTGLKYIIQLRKKLREYLGRDDSDCYVAFLPIAIFCLGSCRRFCKAPIIVSERNNPESYDWFYCLALRICFSMANRCVFQTINAREWYGLSVRREKAVIIPNAINEEFLSIEQSLSRRKEIVSVGRLVAQKNFNLLIRAFAEIDSQFSNYKLVIYGEGPLLNELKQLCYDLGVANRVCFPGYKKNVGSLIKDAALFVMPSNFEGMPNSLIEAMAMGIPCVSTDCKGGGARSIISSGVNGLLVPIDEKDALKQAMEKLLMNPEFADEIAKNAMHIREELEPQKIYRSWADLIGQVCKVK